MTTPPAAARPAHQEPLDARDLADIAERVASARSLWEGRVRCDGPGRDAVRLVDDGRCEVWVIGWPPSHRTEHHDHGRSAGAVVVVDGELIEARNGRSGRLRNDRVIDLPVGVVHDVGTGAAPAISIHVYAPPLSAMTFYEDRTGIPDRVVPIGDERPALTVDEVARVLHPAATRTGR